MNTRQLIATSVLSIFASVSGLALAANPTSHGDGTDHVAQSSSQRDQLSCQEVLREYQRAVAAGEFNKLAGDATVNLNSTKSTATRAEVLSKINGVNLTQGDPT